MTYFHLQLTLGVHVHLEMTMSDAKELGGRSVAGPGPPVNATDARRVDKSMTFHLQLTLGVHVHLVRYS